MSRHSLRTNISSFGKDMRDNCNNRLQEILAMASAARVLPDDALDRDQAYSRIVSAVQDIAGSVNSMEGRILDMVEERLGE